MITFISYLPAILTLLVFAGLIIFIVKYCRDFYAERTKRQKSVEQQRRRNGGQYILEWSGETAQGSPDPEFGRLIVVIPTKSGSGGIFFYEKGLAARKRLPYSEIKDIVYVPGSDSKVKLAKNAIRDSAVMWIYPKKGSAFAIRDLSFNFDDQTMEKIKTGLGFCS